MDVTESSRDTVQLVVAELPHLRSYAIRRRWHDADDLVQATIERALIRLDQFTIGTNVRSWLRTIMHHLYVDTVRHAASEKIVDLPLLPERGAWGNQENAVMLREAQRAMQQLSPEQRDVINLIAVRGATVKETAKILNIHLGTVQSRTHRARTLLRQKCDSN